MPSPEPILRQAQRAFTAEDHIVNVLHSHDWLPLYREDGEELVGIRGKAGAFGATIEGHEIGGDLIEMQPGSSFGTHVHPGDHLLYCIQGEGQVYIDGELRPWSKGDTVFIAAEYPHGVTCYSVDWWRRERFYVPEREIGTDLASGREVAAMVQNPRYEHRHEAPVDASFVILAVGVPHKHVDARDRMHLVDEKEEQQLVDKARSRA